MSEIDRIIKRHFDGDPKAAMAAFSVSKQTISYWRTRGIPELWQYRLREKFGIRASSRKGAPS